MSVFKNLGFSSFRIIHNFHLEAVGLMLNLVPQLVVLHDGETVFDVKILLGGLNG
jgi:hypothetical protein